MRCFKGYYCASYEEGKTLSWLLSLLRCTKEIRAGGLLRLVHL